MAHTIEAAGACRFSVAGPVWASGAGESAGQYAGQSHVEIGEQLWKRRSVRDWFGQPLSRHPSEASKPPCSAIEAKAAAEAGATATTAISPWRTRASPATARSMNPENEGGRGIPQATDRHQQPSSLLPGAGLGQGRSQIHDHDIGGTEGRCESGGGCRSRAPAFARTLGIVVGTDSSSGMPNRLATCRMPTIATTAAEIMDNQRQQVTWDGVVIDPR